MTRRIFLSLAAFFTLFRTGKTEASENKYTDLTNIEFGPWQSAGDGLGYRIGTAIATGALSIIEGDRPVRVYGLVRIHENRQFRWLELTPKATWEDTKFYYVYPFL